MREQGQAMDGPPADPQAPPLPPRPRPGRRRRTRRRGFGASLGLTVLGAILPGSGLLAAGRRVLGTIILVFVAIVIGVIAWAATLGRRELLHIVVEPDALILLGTVLATIGIIWVGVIVITHRVLRPPDATTGQRVLGSALVTVLSLVVLLPMVVGSRYAFVQYDVVTSIFASDDSRSETRPTDATRDNPWAGQDRVNVLLLGSDEDEGRDGIRPDTIMVASIDTDTGQTTLLSLPRNLMNVPFPPDSRLAEVYPNGVFTGPGDWQEYMLLALYRNVPAEHPDLLDSDEPGADAMKLAVGEALGLRVDYFVMLNLQGFRELIDAMDGVTVNVNSRVPIGGDTDAGVPPKDWIEPGPDKHLNGFRALWFARGRYGSSDYDRMDRQRCMMGAIIDQADPTRLVRRYEDIARSSQDMVHTDIPHSLLPAFVDLGLNIDSSDLNSIVFDNTVIDPESPDYDFIRSEVDKAFEQAVKSGENGGGNQNEGGNQNGGGSDGSPDDSSTTDDVNEPDPSDGDGSGNGGGSATEKPKDRCAYQPDEEGTP